MFQNVSATKLFNQKVIILFIIKVRFFILSQRHLKTFISSAVRMSYTHTGKVNSKYQVPSMLMLMPKIMQDHLETKNMQKTALKILCLARIVSFWKSLFAYSIMPKTVKSRYPKMTIMYLELERNN